MKTKRTLGREIAKARGIIDSPNTTAEAKAEAYVIESTLIWAQHRCDWTPCSLIYSERARRASREQVGA